MENSRGGTPGSEPGGSALGGGGPALTSGLLPAEVRRVGAWCAVLLLVSGVVGVGVWIVVTFKTAVTPYCSPFSERRCSTRCTGGSSP